ncbi:MAG: hypothetical protein H6863_06100 [Rhodospirillales bacterium]|nr:hypothetical protein [Rhodospirillales bacterium]
MQNNKGVNYIKPPNYLKQKVGNGGLPESILIAAQELIENTEIDFSPYVKNFLNLIDATIEKTVQSSFRTHDHVTALIYPVMQLKAHGGMFRQPLISEIAANALYFLENIYVLDDDAIEVLRAHQKALIPITNNRLIGYGGTSGKNLVKELHKLCERYYKKHNITLNP